MCSYCGCRDIELIGRLNAEHDAIVNAAGPLGRAVAAGDHAAAVRHLGTLEGLLHPHTALEERGLFAELRRDETFTAHVDALCAEHTALDEGFRRCREGDWSGLADLLFTLREHIEKEENGLFPAALAALDGEQWDRLHADPDVHPRHDPAPDHTHHHDHAHGHAHDHARG